MPEPIQCSSSTRNDDLRLNVRKERHKDLAHLDAHDSTPVHVPLSDVLFGSGLELLYSFIDVQLGKPRRSRMDRNQADLQGTALPTEMVSFREIGGMATFSISSCGEKRPSVGCVVFDSVTSKGTTWSACTASVVA